MSDCTDHPEPFEACFFCRRCTVCKCATVENETSWRCGERVRALLDRYRALAKAADVLRGDWHLQQHDPNVKAYDAARAAVREIEDGKIT